MKVISLGLDNKILNPSSSVARRALVYAANLEEYVALVPGTGQVIDLASNIKVIPSGTKNKVLSFISIYKILRNLLKTNKYQVVTIQDNYWLAVLGVYLARKYQVKVEIQNHGFEKLNYLRKFLASWAFSRADLIRTVSQRLDKFLQTEFKISSNKIYTVPVPIEVKHLASLPKQFNLKEQYPGKFIFLTVGRLVPVKNVALQLKALAVLKNTQAVLLVVGDGAERPNLEALAKSLKIEEQVVFLGWLDNLADYYRGSDCLLLTSFSEGFPLVPSEATVYELPIIMTDVGSAGDLIKDQLNGLLIPINDQSALVKAMHEIISNNALRLKLKQGSRQALGQILEPEQVATIINQHWQDLVYGK